MSFELKWLLVIVLRLSNWFRRIFVIGIFPDQTESWAVDDFIINIILLDRRKIIRSSFFWFLLTLQLFWLKIINWFGNLIQFSLSTQHTISFVERFNGHRLASFESSWLILRFWKSICYHSEVSWASDSGKKVHGLIIFPFLLVKLFEGTCHVV